MPFLAGCNECPHIPPVACGEKIDALVAQLTHERDYHRQRWNATKAAVLDMSLEWQRTEIVNLVHPLGRVC